MGSFDPAAPCQSFTPRFATRRRRRANALHFVAQHGERFVVKSFAAPATADADAAGAAARELAGEAAFVALGEEVVQPCAGPFLTLDLWLDGAPVRLRHALVFPCLEAPTLADVLRTAPEPRVLRLLADAGARLGRRHARARTLEGTHSDGAAHNVLLVDDAPAGEAASRFVWCDFSEAHAANDLAGARAHEVASFVLSVVETSRAGTARARVAAFCDAYPDRDTLSQALAVRTPARPLRYVIRHSFRRRQWFALWRGDTTQLARFRTWWALSSVLAERL